MISINKALGIVEENIKPLNSEIIKVTESFDRILYYEIKAKNSNPAFTISAMDGIAIKFPRSKNKENRIFEIIGNIYAGDKKKYTIKENQAVRIYTGGKIPNGADTVVIQENVKVLENNIIQIKGEMKKYQYVRKKGKDYKKGDILLRKNKKISAIDVALIISAGIKRIKVFKQANVALFASGNELVSPEVKLKDGDVYASSMYMLKELLIKSNCNLKIFKILKDKEKNIIQNLKKIKNIDLIITTGGVSVGKKDLIRSALVKLGFKLKFWKISLVPGKPLLFGILNNTPLFGLPGNPVSSYVCFMLFVLKSIHKMNVSEKIKAKNKKALLIDDLYFPSDRTAYLRGKIFKKNNQDYVRVFKDQDSSLLKTLSDSNCLVRLKASAKTIKKNTMVNLIYFSNY